MFKRFDTTKIVRIVRMARWAILLGPSVAFGQKSPINNYKDLVGRLCDFAYLLYAIGIAVGIIFILITAYRYMTAGGDAAKVSAAHQSILYGLIGFAVAILANGMPSLVSTILGGEELEGCELGGIF